MDPPCREHSSQDRLTGARRKRFLAYVYARVCGSWHFTEERDRTDWTGFVSVFRIYFSSERFIFVRDEGADKDEIKRRTKIFHFINFLDARLISVQFVAGDKPSY